MNSSDAAEQLGTTPKILRRFLRQDSMYTNAAHTSAGRYNFEDSDMPTLRKRFNAWVTKNAGRQRTTTSSSEPVKRKRKVSPDGDPGLPVSILQANPRDRRAETERLGRERAERLEKRLRESGVHLSQLNRDDFRDVQV